MRLMTLALIAGLLGCHVFTVDPDTGERVVDLEALNAEVGLLSDDARSIAAVLEAGGKEEHAETMRGFSASLEVFSAAIETRMEGGEADLGANLDTVLEGLDLLVLVAVDEEDRATWTAYIEISKIALRRFRPYL